MNDTKLVSGDGLPELPEPKSHAAFYAGELFDYYSADQMSAIRDAGIAYGRRLATPEQPEYFPDGSDSPIRDEARGVEQDESIARRIDRVVFDPMRVADKTRKERQPEARDAEHGKCDLGVGCDEAGVCYALANGHPEQCGRGFQPEARGTTAPKYSDEELLTAKELLASFTPSYRAALFAASAEQGEAVELTKCCGREECGGECGNEWRGMEWVRKARPEGMVLVPHTMTLPIANALGYDGAFNTWEEMQETWTEAIAAANPVRAEQPDSSVQGEKAAIEAAALYAWEHASWSWEAVKGGLDRFTTPPPAPAAEQGEVCMTEGDKITAQNEAFDIAESMKPEARGVEGMVLTDEMNEAGEREIAFGNDFQDAWRAAHAAAPNPVQAEQPEGNEEWKQVILSKLREALGTDGTVYRAVKAMLAAAPAAPGVRVDEAMAERLRIAFYPLLENIKRCHIKDALTAALAPDGGEEE